MIIIQAVLYSEKAGLFDLDFTYWDITQTIIIAIGATSRVYYEFIKEDTRNPTIFDIIFTYIISYFLAGMVYQYFISKNYNPGSIMFILGILSTQALTIMNWLMGKKGQDKVEGGLDAIPELIKKILSKWIEK